MDGRAMAGNKSIGENYSFSGVHHIFDQHKAAGKFLVICNLWNWFFASLLAFEYRFVRL